MLKKLDNLLSQTHLSFFVSNPLEHGMTPMCMIRLENCDRSQEPSNWRTKVAMVAVMKT